MIKALGIRYYLASDRLNLWLIALTTLLLPGIGDMGVVPPGQAPTACWPPTIALAETAVPGVPSPPGPGGLLVLFFDLMLVPFLSSSASGQQGQSGWRRPTR